MKGDKIFIAKSFKYNTQIWNNFETGSIKLFNKYNVTLQCVPAKNAHAPGSFKIFLSFIIVLFTKFLIFKHSDKQVTISFVFQSSLNNSYFAYSESRHQIQTKVDIFSLFYWTITSGLTRRCHRHAIW